MSTKLTLSALLAATAIALVPAAAEATTYTRPGWLEVHNTAAATASTNYAGKDYSVGYRALTKFGAANWDVADDHFSYSCGGGTFFPIPCFFMMSPQDMLNGGYNPPDSG